MSRKMKVGILLSAALVVLLSMFLGSVETDRFSAYGACREFALKTKGYAAWDHIHTTQMIFVSWMVFNDGYNDLTCQAVGVGPFWMVTSATKTNVACATELSGDPSSLCPEDYFGVSP